MELVLNCYRMRQKVNIQDDYQFRPENPLWPNIKQFAMACLIVGKTNMYQHTVTVRGKIPWRQQIHIFK